MLDLAKYEEMESQVMEIFRQILFDPIVQILTSEHPSFKRTHIENASDALTGAIQRGEIQYHDGEFTGSFKARTSKELRALGATFNRQTKSFHLPTGKVPPDVKAASALYESKARAANKAIVRKLDDVQQNLDSILQRSKVKADPMVGRVIKDFHDVAKQIEIPFNLSVGGKERLAEGYSNNMELWIRKWCEEEITELRDIVEDNSIEGARYQNLVSQIQTRYSVSQTKAKFLARQETALFVSKFRKEHFKDAGLTHYRWSTSHDERVRPAPWTKGKARLDNHRILDGKIFAYDDPPVVDMATGRRANPGEDFNCRCVDIPILGPIHAVA